MRMCSDLWSFGGQAERVRIDRLGREKMSTEGDARGECRFLQNVEV